jgi:hypothetical protein
MPVDALFNHIGKLHRPRPWGSLLDAGTGKHSLSWIAGLETERWTGVTGDASVAAKLERRFADRMRDGDRIVAGNWNDPSFLHAERYDVVLADYLLGAVEAFAPYFQDCLFARLRPLVAGRLYVVGLSPYPGTTDDPWGKVIVEIAHLRDAAITLAGHSTYREYPLEWCLRHLERAGFEVEDVERFPIVYGPSFIKNQLKVAERKLSLLPDPTLAAALKNAIDELRDRALETYEAYRGTPFGADYVIDARPR